MVPPMPIPMPRQGKLQPALAVEERERMAARTRLM
jgi:hypothetical protein